MSTTPVSDFPNEEQSWAWLSSSGDDVRRGVVRDGESKNVATATAGRKLLQTAD